MTTYILIGATTAILLFIIYVFNGLIRLRNRLKESYSAIDVFLKQRYDMIPNLVETVKGYAKHEKETFENITKARNEAIHAEGAFEQSSAEQNLTGAIKSLFAVAENYPDLKANQNFLDLQKNLVDLENQINNARRYYNAVVRDFNIKQEVFPNNVFSSILGFKKADYFELDNENERENVEIKV